MSAISSATEVAIKQTVENAIKDYHASILPYLGARPMMAGGDVPIGAVNFFDDVDAPQGWVKANGAELNIADYPYLADHYERVHGSKNFYGGDGTTTFKVPNLQGEFLRGTGTNGHTNQGSGGNVGAHQDGTIIGRTATNGTTLYSYNDQTDYGNTYDNPDKHQVKASGAQYISLTGTNTAEAPATYGYTTKPTNTSFLICIKAVPHGMIFSEDEQYYGKWIDGSDVWWKVVEISGTIIGSTTPVTITRDLSSQLTNVNKIIDTRLSGENTNNHRFYQGYGGYMGVESPSSGYQGFSYTINSQMVIEISMMINQVTLGNMKLIIFYTKTY